MPDRVQKHPVLNFFDMVGSWGQVFIIVFYYMDASVEALVWAGYIDFLQTELAALHLSNPANSLPPQNRLPLRFEDYIVSTQQTIMPFLLSQLSGQKPKHFAAMLFALRELGLIKPTTITHNQTELHQALENTFGKYGSRSALNNNIKKLNAASADEQKLMIKYNVLITNHSRL